MNRCEKARGTVVYLLWETVTDDEGTTEISYPIIEYTVVGTGAVITAQGMVGSSPPDHQVGDVVDILYDPHEPLYVYMDNFWDILMAQSSLSPWAPPSY